MVSSLRDAGVPNSWNPRSKRHKAMGDARKPRKNEDIVKANAGGKLTSEKEEALMDCLKAGSLTWGDYDILVGKLRGESDRTSIAETLEWVNMIINRVWPAMRRYLESKIMSEIQERITAAAAALPGQSWTGLNIDIKRANLGANEPSFSTIEAIKRMKNGKQGLHLFFNNIAFNSNIDVHMEVTVAGIVTPVQVKDVKFTGTLAVELHEFTSELPIVGTIEAYFPNPPHVDLQLHISGNSEIPAVRGLSVSCVNDAIASCMVLPNTLYCNVRDPSEKPTKKHPAGVLRLSVVRARHLIAGDMAISYISEEKSDAYAYIRLGAETKQTEVITSFDPEWKEQFDFVVHDMSQWVDVEVFDSDIKADDSLGSVLQKETVLGGGTDIISRGIPVEALCRKIWSADDRNKEYVTLPLGMKVKDEELSIDTDPYIGARIIYKGGGKYKGAIEFEDGTVVDVGDEGVVEAVDESTKPFATFTCSFPKAEGVELNGGDVEVTKPLMVYTIDQLKGKDGEDSAIHLHPEWLTTNGPGLACAQLVELHAQSITGLPELAERDLGIPYRLRVTLQDQSAATEKHPVLETRPGAPEVESDCTLPAFISTITKMKAGGKSSEEVAKTLQITAELVDEAATLFAASATTASSPKAAKAGGKEKTLRLLPHGKKKATPVDFKVREGEAEADVRARLGTLLKTETGSILKLTLKKNNETIAPLYDKVEDNVEVYYKPHISPATHSWLSRAHAHVNKVRGAANPFFLQTLHAVTPSQHLPTVRYEILASGGTVLGSAQMKPESNGEYPLSAEVIVEQEAAGGWGFGVGAKEGYKYTCQVHCGVTTSELKMRS